MYTDCQWLEPQEFPAWRRRLEAERRAGNLTLARQAALIPRLSDQNRCAQPRMPIDIISQGWASNLFQAWQQ